MKKRVLCLVLVLISLAMLVIPAHSEKASLFFVAFNDTVPLGLPAEHAPFVENSVLLVPYTVFDMEEDGLTPSYNKEGKMLTIFTRRQRLVFDLKKGEATDEDGNVTSVICTVKDGIAYVPLRSTVRHFGLTGTLLTSEAGYPVVRITDGTQVYDNEQFLRRAETRIDYYVHQYLTSQPSVPPVEDDPVPTPPAASRPEVYLAVVGTEHAKSSLNLLRQSHVPAVFFFTYQQMQEAPDLLLQVLAAGYKVGLTASQDSQNVAQDLRLANETLDEIGKTKSLLVCLAAQQKDGISSYQVIDLGKAVPAEQAALKDGASLVLCDENIAQTLAILNQADAQYHTIRETSSF